MKLLAGDGEVGLIAVGIAPIGVIAVGYVPLGIIAIGPLATGLVAGMAGFGWVRGWVGILLGSGVITAAWSVQGVGVSVGRGAAMVTGLAATTDECTEKVRRLRLPEARSPGLIRWWLARRAPDEGRTQEAKLGTGNLSWWSMTALLLFLALFIRATPLHDKVVAFDIAPRWSDAPSNGWEVDLDFFAGGGGLDDAGE